MASNGLGGSETLAGIINHVKGVTSLGRHTRPACNARHDIVLNQKSDFLLTSIQCVSFLTSGTLWGPGNQWGISHVTW